MKDKVKNILSNMIPHFRLAQGVSIDSVQKVRLWGEEYSITKWNDEVYKKSLNELTKLYKNNSAELVENIFSSALAKILTSDDQSKSIETESEEFVNFVSQCTKDRSVCIPLQGIDLRVDNIDLGFGTLYRSDKGRLPDIIHDRDSLRSYQHRINALNDCMCYFQVEIKTDHEYSVDHAKHCSQYLSALLNLYVGSTQYRTERSFYSWSKRDRNLGVGRNRKIAIHGSESGDCQVYYEFYKNDDSPRKPEFYLEFNLLSPGHDASESINECLEFMRPEKAKTTYHLVDEKVKKSIILDDNKLLLDCVQKRNEIEKRVHQAVSWFGKAVNADVPEDQFLFFAISVESLLVGKESSNSFSSQGSITQKISERSAFLLGDCFEKRIKIEDKVKKIYGVRSKIVHTGAKASKLDVIRIEEVTRDLIFKFSQKNFTSHEEFQKWIKKQQYGEQ